MELEDSELHVQHAQMMCGCAYANTARLDSNALHRPDALRFFLLCCRRLPTRMVFDVRDGR